MLWYYQWATMMKFTGRNACVRPVHVPEYISFLNQILHESSSSNDPERSERFLKMGEAFWISVFIVVVAHQTFNVVSFAVLTLWFHRANALEELLFSVMLAMMTAPQLVALLYGISPNSCSPELVRLMQAEFGFDPTTNTYHLPVRALLAALLLTVVDMWGGRSFYFFERCRVFVAQNDPAPGMFRNDQRQKTVFFGCFVLWNFLLPRVIGRITEGRVFSWPSDRKFLPVCLISAAFFFPAFPAVIVRILGVALGMPATVGRRWEIPPVTSTAAALLFAYWTVRLLVYRSSFDNIVANILVSGGTSLGLAFALDRNIGRVVAWVEGIFQFFHEAPAPVPLFWRDVFRIPTPGGREVRAGDRRRVW